MRKFGRSFETRPTRTARSIAFGARTALVALGAALATLTATIAITAVLAAISVTALAARTALVGTLGELLGHRFERLVAADDGEGLDLVHLGAGLNDRQDLDAVDVELGIDLDDVAGLATRRENRSIEDTLGLARAGCSPRPGAVGARTRQLDLDPAGHGS